MRAVVYKSKVSIYLTDNFAITYNKNDKRIKINHKSVLWYSPLTDLPVPVPIE